MLTQNSHSRVAPRATSLPARFVRLLGRMARGDIQSIKRTWENLANRASEYYYERKFAVHTEGELALSELGIAKGECVHYNPVPYRFLRKVFASLPVQAGEDVFLD